MRKSKKEDFNRHSAIAISATDFDIETSIRSHGTTVDVDVFKYGTLATSVSSTKTGVVAWLPHRAAKGD